MTTTHRFSGQTPSAFLFISLMLLAANLRAPFTNVGPIQDLIQATYELSATAVGLLTTLPLAAFAVISPFAPLVARRFGLELSLVVAMGAIALGAAVRSFTPMWGLYVGTACLGIGIVLGNVLLPSVIKRDFASRIPTATGLSTVMMGFFGAMFSMSMVPLAHWFGWRIALSTNCVLAGLAMLVWLKRLRSRELTFTNGGLPTSNAAVWRTPLAWYITLYMGTNSFLYYVLISWLPSILSLHGYSPAQAGTIHGVMQLATAVPGLFLGPIIGRMNDHRLLAIAVAGLMTAAVVGLMVLPQFAIVWVFLFGASSCCIIILAFVFMGSRSHNSDQTASLSGMAQSVGYLLAATGPFLAGLLHQQFQTWSAPMLMLIVMGIVMIIFGAKAAKPGVMMPSHST